MKIIRDRTDAIMPVDGQVNPLAAVDAVILCGGRGTRLRSIFPDRAKALVPIGGRPFLDIVVHELRGQGFERIIFCVGHRKEEIIAHYRPRRDGEFVFAEEDEPLGTGGAVMNALPSTRSDPIVVLNGDSWCRVDFQRLYRWHCEKAAAATLVLTAPAGREDGGLVKTDQSGRILSFAEKAGAATNGQYVNAGIYVLEKSAIARGRATIPYSLEHDLFPALSGSQPCFGFFVSGPLIDIGTPERYGLASGLCEAYFRRS